MAKSKWTFEPGHTAAEFCARHMMVTWVRGHLKDVHGTLEFDPDDPLGGRVDVVLDARKIWTGEPARDEHLRSEDFLDVEKHPEIRFRGTFTERLGQTDFQVAGELSIRGATRPTTLDVRYLGQWRTPWWEGGRDLGPRTRAGFTARTRIHRQDFGITWQDRLENQGVVVSDQVFIALDAEAIRD